MNCKGEKGYCFQLHIFFISLHRQKLQLTKTTGDLIGLKSPLPTLVLEAVTYFDIGSTVAGRILPYSFRIACDVLLHPKVGKYFRWDRQLNVTSEPRNNQFKVPCPGTQRDSRRELVSNPEPCAPESNALTTGPRSPPTYLPVWYYHWQYHTFLPKSTSPRHRVCTMCRQAQYQHRKLSRKEMHCGQTFWSLLGVSIIETSELLGCMILFIVVYINCRYKVIYTNIMQNKNFAEAKLFCKFQFPAI